MRRFSVFVAWGLLAAAALGMRGIQFVGHDELVAALGEQGLKVGVIGGLSE